MTAGRLTELVVAGATLKVEDIEDIGSQHEPAAVLVAHQGHERHERHEPGRHGVSDRKVEAGDPIAVK